MNRPEPPTFRARVVLRPRSLDEVFDLALAYLRAHFRDLRILLLLAVAVPPGVSAIVALLFHLLSAELHQAIALFIFTLGTTSTALEKAATLSIGRHLFETPVEVREVLLRLLREAPRWIAEGVLGFLPVLPFLLSDLDLETMVGLSTLLFLLRGVAVLSEAQKIHLSEVRLLERLSGRRARQRALDLSLERHTRNLAFAAQRVALRGLFIGAGIGAAETLTSFVLQIEGATMLSVVAGAALGYAASGPYVAVARLFDYVDARTRGEGWDIQVRFQRIAQRARALAGEPQ